MVARKTYTDAVEFSVPNSLSDLKGPGDGIFELPIHIYWGPDRTVRLPDRSDIQKMYQALIRTGTREDQQWWLNRELLVTHWPDLVLPKACAEAWRSRFPELRGDIWEPQPHSGE